MNGFLYIGGIILFSLLFLMPYFYVSDPFFIWGLFLSLFLCLLMKNRKIQYNGIDICLLLNLLFCGISFYVTANILTEITNFIQCSYVLLYYFTLRFWLAGMKEIRGLLFGYVICIGLLSILATAYFILFQKDVNEMEFSSLYDFRFLFHPLGVVNNEWASLQILFEGIILLAYNHYQDLKKRRWIVCIGILVFLQILWSFSRSIYLLIPICAIGILFIVRKNITRKKYLQTCGVFCLIFISFLFVYSQEVKQTLKLNETISQQRSIDGRLDMWNLTGTVIKGYPWGTGSRTYPMILDKYLKKEKRPEGYSAYATNLISQLLVEKGMIGFILYFSFFIVLLLYVIQRREKGAWLAFIFLFVFLCREQTFSVFSDSIRIQWSFYTLLAFMQVPSTQKLQNNRKAWWGLCFLPLLIWTACLFGRLWGDRNNRLNAECCSAVQNKDWNRATTEIEKTERVIPHLVNRGLIYLNLFDQLLDKQFLQKADHAIQEAQNQNPHDVQLDYYRLIIKNKIESREERDLFELKRLAERYPDKLIFKWTLYEWYCKKQDWDNAENSLKECILQAPRLLDTDYWRKKTEEDTVLVRNMENILKIQISKEFTEDPILLAKYGSISLKLGNLSLAEKYLKGALERLPNLSMAWYNLGDLAEMKGEKEESRLYKRRANILGGEVKKIELDRLLRSDYNLRFRIWYGCKKIK